MRALVLATLVLIAACAARRETLRADTAPKIVTVPQIQDMVDTGAPTREIFALVQGSGTVYRLDPEQYSRLQSIGLPPAIVSYMQLTYDYAVRQQPALATSDDRWTRVDGYWYGGRPVGWPREWVVDSPPPK